MTVQQTTPPRPGQRCRICGTLSRTGRVVEHIGWCGPECVRKVAALHETLERAGLTEMFGGRVEFYPVESEDLNGVSMWTWPADIDELRVRAERLGLRFEWHWPRTDGPAQCYVRLPQNVRARKRLFGGLGRVVLGVAA